MRKSSVIFISMLFICLLFIPAAFSSDADLYDIDENCKFDRSSVKWLDYGREISFTYWAYPRDANEQKQFDEYYKVSGAQIVLYNIKVYRDQDIFFDIARTWLTDEAGNVIYENSALQGKKLISASVRVQKCYNMIVKDSIGLSANDVFEFANKFMKDKELDKAFPFLHFAANNENSLSKAVITSQFLLGYCYTTGQGTKQDYEQGRLWLKKASDAGQSNAANILGEIYYKGLGIPSNYETAAKYFKLAADKDNITGLKNLARLYMNGQGVTKSREKAMLYLRRAAQLGDEESAQIVAKIEQQQQQQTNQTIGIALEILGKVIK